MLTKTFLVGEIELRYTPKHITNYPVVCSSKETHKLLIEFFNEEIISIQEQFIILYLNQASHLIGFYCMSYGGMTGTVADIRLILGVALKTACTQIIVAHNHPSGNLQPSHADKELTRKLKESADVMDIKLLDHLIVTASSQYYSFADEGLI